MDSCSFALHRDDGSGDSLDVSIIEYIFSLGKMLRIFQLLL